MHATQRAILTALVVFGALLLAYLIKKEVPTWQAEIRKAIADSKRQESESSEWSPRVNSAQHTLLEQTRVSGRVYSIVDRSGTTGNLHTEDVLPDNVMAASPDSADLILLWKYVETGATNTYGTSPSGQRMRGTGAVMLCGSLYDKNRGAVVSKISGYTPETFRNWFSQLYDQTLPVPSQDRVISTVYSMPSGVYPLRFTYDYSLPRLEQQFWVIRSESELYDHIAPNRAVVEGDPYWEMAGDEFLLMGVGKTRLERNDPADPNAKRRLRTQLAKLFDVPEVDWTKQMIIGVFLKGAEPNSSPTKRIDVAFYEEADTLVVNWGISQRFYKKLGAPLVKEPYGSVAVLVERHDGPIRFEAFPHKPLTQPLQDADLTSFTFEAVGEQ